MLQTIRDLHNTRQCEEKLVRNSVALMKEMLENHEVKHIEWVETSKMLADCWMLD